MKAVGRMEDGALEEDSPAAELALQRHDLRQEIVVKAKELGFKACGV